MVKSTQHVTWPLFVHRVTSIYLVWTAFWDVSSSFPLVWIELRYFSYTIIFTRNSFNVAPHKIASFRGSSSMPSNTYCIIIKSSSHHLFSRFRISQYSTQPNCLFAKRSTWTLPHQIDSSFFFTFICFSFICFSLYQPISSTPAYTTASFYSFRNQFFLILRTDLHLIHLWPNLLLALLIQLLFDLFLTIHTRISWFLRRTRRRWMNPHFISSSKLEHTYSKSFLFFSSFVVLRSSKHSLKHTTSRVQANNAVGNRGMFTFQNNSSLWLNDFVWCIMFFFFVSSFICLLCTPTHVQWR